MSGINSSKENEILEESSSNSPYGSLFYALNMPNTISKQINSLTQLKRQLKSNIPENSTFDFFTLPANNDTPYAGVIFIRKSEENLNNTPTSSSAPSHLPYTTSSSNDLADLEPQVDEEIVQEEDEEKFANLVIQDIDNLIENIKSGNLSSTSASGTTSMTGLEKVDDSEEEGREGSFENRNGQDGRDLSMDIDEEDEENSNNSTSFNKKLTKFNLNKYLKNLNKRDHKTLSFIKSPLFLTFLKILKSSPSKKNKQYPLAYDFFNKSCSEKIKKENLNCSLLSFYIKKFTGIFIRARTLILWKNKMLFKNITTSSSSSSAPLLSSSSSSTSGPISLPGSNNNSVTSSTISNVPTSLPPLNGSSLTGTLSNTLPATLPNTLPPTLPNTLPETLPDSESSHGVNSISPLDQKIAADAASSAASLGLLDEHRGVGEEEEGEGEGDDIDIFTSQSYVPGELNDKVIEDNKE